jgi:hypothetical protein
VGTEHVGWIRTAEDMDRVRAAVDPPVVQIEGISSPEELLSASQGLPNGISLYFISNYYSEQTRMPNP